MTCACYLRRLREKKEIMKIEQKRRRVNEGRGERRRRGVQTEKENREMERGERNARVV